MDTKPLERFAKQARRDLLTAVDARATAVLATGSVARAERPEVVRKLEAEIAAHGREHVIDKVAYTWFNRIIALRFMDARGYTDAGIVSPAQGQSHGQPEILAEAKRGNLDADVVNNKSTAERILGLLDGSRRSTDAEGEAYALLLTDYCRHWHKSMPFMFEREGDYTELLVPIGLLADGAILSKARHALTEEVCDDVEVIGWLYQFYISERKDEVFAGFKKNKKAGADEIPAATQLFTPHWIVRYLVENSVGRLWMLNRPNSRLVDRMDYYIAPVDDETDFLKINKPEELTVVDPACGSGHMLTYAFDLLHAIYEEEGYSPSEIPSLILTHNLHGTEIDPRAGSLAAFVLTMKAAARRRLFLKSPVQPRVCVLANVRFDQGDLDYLSSLATGISVARADFDAVWNSFEHADTFGSLIQPSADLVPHLRSVVAKLEETGNLLAATARRAHDQADVLTRVYSVVVANPPYMGSGNMGARLAKFVADQYPAAKQDLYSCFVSRSRRLLPSEGVVGIVTGDNWMNIKSFEGFRDELLNSASIESMLHIHDGNGHPDVFGANSAFALQLGKGETHRGVFVRLDAMGSEAKERQLSAALSGRDQSRVYLANSSDFRVVPRSPIAYWMDASDRAAFGSARPIAQVADGGNGLTTGENDKFFRLWWEVSRVGIEFTAVAGSTPPVGRWFPLNKGGAFRRWAGNQEYIIDWSNRGAAIKALRPKSTVRNEQHYFKPSVSWSDVTAGDSSFRFYGAGFVFDASANAYFPDDKDVPGLLSVANSSFVRRMLKQLSPGLHYKLGDVGVLPYLRRSDEGWESEIRELISLAQEDWDSTETAWSFSRLSGVTQATRSSRIAESFAEVLRADLRIVERVLELETKNDREIAAKYGLNESYGSGDGISRVPLTRNPWFGETQVTPEDEIVANHRVRLIVDLVSYAVGCMLGRYSLDEPGLILADQGSTLHDYLMTVPQPTFMPDQDNVIPFVDDGWFGDDIVERFRQFLRVAFGSEHLEENLRFVEESLGVKTLRDYFISKAGKSKFYDDHVQRYKKRPIYWMFSSPKGSFNALVYMHRYNSSTVSTVLNEYLREYRAKLEVALANADQAGAAGSIRDQKEADRLRKVLAELSDYEHDVLYPLATQQIAIDLDDGVKANYPKFYPALRKIAGLEAAE